MEKIQIQFKQSEYSVYHDYCQKYYQIHDSVRKQSIHVFIELFLKGILPVGNQDIFQARRMFSEKCDVLKKEHYGSKTGEPAKLLQIRVCSDILLFIEDLEKMYRLIEKDGATADFPMILGTFYRVIEENRDVRPPVAYVVKKDMIESLALALVDSIRPRLGSDRQWRSVLRELTWIAARFNLRSSDVKFDLDCLQLVAPAVVSHFDTVVQSREVLSVLPSCFEERELEEFATFLSHEPDKAKKKQEAGINWDVLFDPMTAVANEVAIQRERGSPGGPKPADSTSLASVSALFPVPQEEDSRTFDIVVSPDPSNPDAPPRVVSRIAPPPPEKPGIKPVILVVCGIAIIIAFVLGTMVGSGYGNGSSAGSTTSPVKVTMTTGLPTATPTPQATTAKPVTTVTPKPTPTPTPSSTPAKAYSAAEIGNHLIETAFGPDNNVIRKPTKDLLSVSYAGMYDTEDTDLLNNFISQFNNYSSTTKLSENINFNSAADISVDFLPASSLSQVNKNQNTSSVYQDAGTGTYYFVRTPERTFVSNDLKGNERKRWILRALLNNLGFYGETAKYPDSVFYAGPNTVSQLSDIDWKAVQLMYGKKIINGMAKANVRATF